MLGMAKIRLKRFEARSFVILILIAAGVFFFYVWHLSSLVPGLNRLESRQIDSSRAWHSLIDNPVNLPHKVLQSGLLHGGQDDIFWLRLVSVFFVLITVWAFYRLGAAWFGKTVSFFSTLFFASTPLVILLARSATAQILYFFPVLLLAVYYWMYRTARTKTAWFILVALAALCFYIPGGALLVLGSAVIARNRYWPLVRTFGVNTALISSTLALAIWTPLVLALINDPHLAKSLLPLPQHWQSALETVKSVLWTLPDLVWRTKERSLYTLGRLPLLSVVQITLFVFGVYAMATRARRQLWALLAIIALGMLIAGLNYDVTFLAISLGPIGLICAAGLRYLFLEWREIFPRNPLPKALALVVVAAVVAISVAYGLRYCLAAWPHSSETRSSYMIK